MAASIDLGIDLSPESLSFRILTNDLSSIKAPWIKPLPLRPSRVCRLLSIETSRFSSESVVGIPLEAYSSS